MAARPFRRQLPRLVEGLKAGMYQGANRIGNRSQELVPYETGTLKASERVLPPEDRPGGVTVVVGYGYGDTPNPLSGEPASGYAIFVHERLDVHHPHGQAKFLEQAAQELGSEVLRDIGAAIQRNRVVDGELVVTIEPLEA